MTTSERDDLLESLQFHRGMLLGTLEGLDEEQAAASPSVSELSLVGIVKHVAVTEQGWMDFAERGPGDAPAVDWDDVDWSDPPAEVLEQANSFRLLEGESLATATELFQQAAARTDALVGSADLDQRWPLPPAPWFEPGATRSVRRVVLGLIGEIAQHAGHADVIRETIDGRKSMG